MAVDADRGYDISGVLFIGDVAFFTGIVSPWLIPIINAPINSIYIRNDAEIFHKTGAGDDAGDWVQKVFLPAAEQTKDVVQAGETTTIAARNQIIILQCYEIELNGTLEIQADATFGVL